MYDLIVTMLEQSSYLQQVPQTDYDRAVDLAYEANNAFDMRQDAARGLAELLSSSRTEGDEAEEMAKLQSAQQRFKGYQLAASVLMPSQAAFEMTAEPAKPFAHESIWEAMSREQRTKASELRTTLAASELKEYGVTEDSLRVVMTKKDGKRTFTLLHTGNGVDIGDPQKNYDRARGYDAVMSRKNDDLFRVTVNGTTYDARQGMTDAVYTAKIEDARMRRVNLPDSKQLSQETDDDWTSTMLTGEGLTADGCVPVRRVEGNDVSHQLHHAEHVLRSIRVCPAVEIG
jgi:hypothetical protein